METILGMSESDVTGYDSIIIKFVSQTLPLCTQQELSVLGMSVILLMLYWCSKNISHADSHAHPSLPPP